MSDLSERDIEEAAREAGITPAELRGELARQRGVAPAGSAALVHLGERGLLPASERGTSIANAESTLPFPAEQAVRTIKRSIEQQVGSRGHMMGSQQADVYDEQGGVIYRVQAEDDGQGGSLVRIDIDPTPVRAKRMLMAMGLGATIGLFFLSGVIIPGLLGTALVGAAIGMGVIGGISLGTQTSRASRSARYVASTALVEAEHGSSRALPPGEPY
ncbi:hypothetical protein ACNOYE_04755 [Nannocystaceae bacterium ST9]